MLKQLFKENKEDHPYEENSKEGIPKPDPKNTSQGE